MEPNGQAMDNNPPITEILHKSDILKGLTDEQCAKVTQGGQNEKLHPKRTLFLQGDPADKFYMVHRGRLKLSRLNELGKEVIIRYIGVGEMTAAVAVLKDLDYPVTAEAVEETEVTGWDKPTFLRLIHDYPEIAINMLGVVLERLDEECPRLAGRSDCKRFWRRPGAAWRSAPRKRS